MSSQKKGTHDYQDDPRNATIMIDINGEFFTREQATVSVFDSGFVLGDGVWEGLRVHHGKIAFLDQHLERLYEGMCLLLGEIWGYSTRWATAGSTGTAGAQKKL